MKNKVIGGIAVIAIILLIPSIMPTTVQSPDNQISYQGLYTSVNTSENANDYQAQEQCDDLQTSKIPVLLQESQSILKITDIASDTTGIAITVANRGQIDASDIEMDVTSTEGLFVFIPKKQYKIPQIKSGESTQIHISILGLGMGLATDYPQITCSLHSSDKPDTTGKITANIIGPFVTIIGKVYDENKSYKGYTLFAPMWDRQTYLMDNNGTIVHSWRSIYLDTQASYLLENGNLARTSLVADASLFAGGDQGRIELFDWNGTKLWNFEYSTDQYCQHHDIEPLPNGNFLVIAWELKTVEETVSAGRNPTMVSKNGFWPDHIIEVEPTGYSTGKIVWEWHAWDHIIQQFDPTKENYGIIKDHPELIDINYGGQRNDWLHINSVDYNEEFDQILLSVHNFNEIWIIDHSTTTEEAASHTGGRYDMGGDLLYRWGNPRAYRHGDENDQKFFGQHDARWIEPGNPGEGNILVFNNNKGGRQARYSSVEEIVPPVDENGIYHYITGSAYGPKEQIWVYIAENPLDLYSSTCSSSQRLPNGNTLICSANQGIFYEVTAKKEVIWSYVNPYHQLSSQTSVSVTEIFRYPLDYPGLIDIEI